MGRIGKRKLLIPKGVEVKVERGRLKIKGPLGAMEQDFSAAIEVKVEQDKLATLCASTDRIAQAKQGLYNSIFQNMLTGVTKGFIKELELVGVGYRAQMQGKKLQLQLGYSHPVEVDPPPGVDFEVTAGTKIKIKGVDRQKVGQVAAEIRGLRKVEPYKGKGIKYTNEVVRRKAGKAAKAIGAGTGV